MPAAASSSEDRQAASPTGPLTTIQYLRAVAALMVVWHHSLGQVPGLSEFLPRGDGGSSGVDLFFVISGFIMVYTTHGKPTSPWQFLRRRVVRVVPLYWLLTLAVVAAANLLPALFRTTQTPVWHVVLSLLFVPHWSPSHPGQAWPVMVPGWTLNYEMLFYALFAASLAWPGRRRVEGLAVLLVGAALLGVVVGSFDSAVLHLYTRYLMVEFGCGMLLAQWWLRRGRALPAWPSALAIAVGAPLLWCRDTLPFAQWNQALGALLVVLGALSPRWLHGRSRLGLALGDASYSIYLTHLFTLGLLRELWRRGALPTNLPMAWTFMALALSVCAAVGWCSLRWLERPLLRFLR